MGVPSGPAHWLCAALISVATGCDPLSFAEREQLAIGDGGIVMVDDAFVAIDDAPPPPVDAPVEGAADAPTEGPPPDAPMEGGFDAAPDAAAVPDAAVPPDAAPPTDGGPGDGSLTDALQPDAPDRPDLGVNGSHEDQIKSFYACSTGDGASALPLLLAILALRRRRR